MTAKHCQLQRESWVPQTVTACIGIIWFRFGEYSHFLKDRSLFAWREKSWIPSSYQLWPMEQRQGLSHYNKHQEKKLAVPQRSMQRSLLNITKRDKIRNEIRSKIGVKDIIERVQSMRTVGRTYSQNEQHQVGKDNIKMDTQRQKTSKRGTQKEMERQHRGSW